MNNYDGQNPYYGGAGGGYVAGGSPYGSQDSPSRKTRGGNQTIRPVTVKQILEAQQVHPDADFTIDGVDVAQVLLVGSVRNMSTTATNVSYEIGDGTGYIDARVWLDSADDDSGKTTGVEQDHYVGLMGTIKVFGGKRHVSATHIRPITDANEVQHHLLKALYVSLILRGGAPGNAPKAAGTRDDYNAGATTGMTDQSAWSHLEPLQRRILEVMSSEGQGNDDGVHVTHIIKFLNGVDENDFTVALDWLTDNGYVYSTLDESHYQVL
ncbi:uncharacterized protein IAS62_000213 [Cryptococcus decagattii]|uniref:Replication protein A C-terminal domain-containing protein n=1 Tax=Cryptococcus decagattii TaxID=1859122 RepID=A0ABZ2AKF2_9TREE